MTTTQTDTTADRLAEMLQENTGRTILDSGDYYGRHWEQNQDADFQAQPEGRLESWERVAEMEQQTREERQAAGIKAARERGVYLGRQPGTTKAKPARARKLRERGLNDSEIARALGVSRRTVQRYIKP